MLELDQVDQQIIDLLRSDGRMTVSEMAKRLSMPETTTRYRVQRLIQSETVKVLAWPNPEKLGKPNILIVSMVVDNSRIRAIAEDFLRMEEVRYVAVITGRFNLMIDVFFGVHAELMAFFEKLQQIPGIISYESHFILDLLRAEYKYTLG
ncbi:MAG: AsnC family transcriptional regulator [Stenomitos rutilans HA7619-LM2]|nr:AsnC family transcriptional regulator [Stenomitos rutilans HA7619-LM2]